MCVNEPFVQACSSEERICRTFIVEDQEGNELRRFQINVAQFLSSGEVNVSSVFTLMAEKGLSTQGKYFYIPLLGVPYTVGQKPLFVPLAALHEKKISVIEQSNDNSPASDVSSCLGEELHVTKKQKQPERVIRSVLENVKLWRHLHSRDKKMSLTDAAKVVGISKKTLDDYFLQLRLGELYGFDFKNNLDEKIGQVRAHIRKHEDKSLEANLPKAIRSFELVRDIKELECLIAHECEDTRHREMGSEDELVSAQNYLNDLI